MNSFSHSFDLIAFILRLNTISLSVMVILLLMSVLTWYLIMTKALQLSFIWWRSRQLLKLFWYSPSLISVMNYLSQKKTHDPFSNLALQGINAAIFYEKRLEKQLENLGTQSEFLTRNMRRAIAEGTAHLESDLSLLATIASTAPFIGLLGTVLGIYDALITISAKGTASLDTVAAPVGEALIMTALGLAVAIPAVLGYNALVAGNRILLSKLDGFAHDLHTCLNTGARIDMKNQVYIKQQSHKNY